MLILPIAIIHIHNNRNIQKIIDKVNKNFLFNIITKLNLLGTNRISHKVQILIAN